MGPTIGGGCESNDLYILEATGRELRAFQSSTKREECSGIDDLVMHHYKVLGVFLFLDIGYDIRYLNCEACQYVKQCRNTYLVSINKNLIHSDVWCALLTSVYGLWT